ncbi:unnamed protein product [Ilex paraguariensis]|uniref:Protein LURP-one-related 8 n=1 Tax=Ilex paraguariensis TaxID=185542 RepID=A0ABC8RC10_9AQUA
MTKVYPNTSATATVAPPVERDVVVLTVWKKSLLLNCDGFTVFDAKGNLVFRVDNYIAGRKGEIILMDCSGKSLLTIRRKRLSLSDSWLVFEGETVINPQYSVTKHMNLLKTKSLAYVSSCFDGNGSPTSSPKKKKVIYEIEGSYNQRCSAVYDDKRRLVAEIKRKEAKGGVAFGMDIFRLIVQPEIDSSVAMALVILLDQMFGS